MRPRSALFVIAALVLPVLSSACGSGDDADAGADSTALATAAADAVSATLRGTTLGDRSQGGITIEPGASAWDTLFAQELRRLESPPGAPQTDSARVLALSTHGVQIAGDTATVMVVLRTCATGAPSLNFSRDSLVHRLVRSDTAGRSWRVLGPVMHDHAVGTCAPADSAVIPAP
jgi:hypothetical protein